MRYSCEIMFQIETFFFERKAKSEENDTNHTTNMSIDNDHALLRVVVALSV